MDLLEYEKPLLYDLHAAVTAEGWACGAGGKNNRSCASGSLAGGTGSQCTAGTSGYGCSNGTTASTCVGGTSANSTNCCTGSGVNATCSTGTGAPFGCSSGTST